MTNILLKVLTPQAAAVYKNLEENKAKSAKEIGEVLKIFPNTVYRAAKQLIELGLIKEVEKYPVKFIAKPASEGLDVFSSVMRQDFQNIFGRKTFTFCRHKLLDLVFVQKRIQTLRMTKRDTYQAKESINLIASGLELPAETLLANQRAAERGVKVRLIVQNMDEVTPAKIRSWKKAGIEIKYFPNMEARIYIYDHHIVYFTSYDPNNIQEAVGMRFDYAPYAAMMDELFEQRWKMGKGLS
ncbi:MAG: phospholipase D-like domain-containing protein [Patescibacteria group bacterium]|nr:phospholipase D-like domain-containing protein [Patescibacteria group bacterium]